LDVFDRDDIRIHLADDSIELGPQTGPLAVESGLRPHRADVLAREPAGHDLDTSEPRAIERTDVVDLLDLGPMTTQHRAAVRIPLDEARWLGAEPAIQREVESADAGEQREHARPDDPTHARAFAAHAASLAHDSQRIQVSRVLTTDQSVIDVETTLAVGSRSSSHFA
jgi:hypothetical protein